MAAIAVTARCAVIEAHGDVSLTVMGVGSALASAGLPMVLGALRWSPFMERLPAWGMWAGSAAMVASSTYAHTAHAGVTALLTAFAAFGPAYAANACGRVLAPFYDRLAAEQRQLRALRLAEHKARLEALDMGEEATAPETPDRSAEAGVEAWAAEHVSHDVNGRLGVKEAYEAQYVWARVNGYAACPNDKTFGSHFKRWAEANGGDHAKSNGSMIYTGLTLKVSETATALLGGPK